MRFEEIEHTADRAFRVQGRTFAELLENAARAMSPPDRGQAGNRRWSAPSKPRESIEKRCW
jgi:hypothetical protein